MHLSIIEFDLELHRAGYEFDAECAEGAVWVDPDTDYLDGGVHCDLAWVGRSAPPNTLTWEGVTYSLCRVALVGGRERIATVEDVALAPHLSIEPGEWLLSDTYHMGAYTTNH